MKDLLIAILILAALIALFSQYGSPVERTKAEGWGATEGNQGSPAPDDGDTPAQGEAIVTEYIQSPKTGYY